jgi:uncharacterized protein (DUF305 family)
LAEIAAQEKEIKQMNDMITRLESKNSKVKIL